MLSNTASKWMEGYIDMKIGEALCSTAKEDRQQTIKVLEKEYATMTFRQLVAYAISEGDIDSSDEIYGV